MDIYQEYNKSIEMYKALQAFPDELRSSTYIHFRVDLTFRIEQLADEIAGHAMDGPENEGADLNIFNRP
jgi:hypothetical protein